MQGGIEAFNLLLNLQDSTSQIFALLYVIQLWHLWKGKLEESFNMIHTIFFQIRLRLYITISFPGLLCSLNTKSLNLLGREKKRVHIESIGHPA